jgi:hypothetical protein
MESMPMLAVLVFTAFVFLTPPPAPVAVTASQLQGSSLCLANGDGTYLLVDAPTPDYEWFTHKDAQYWFTMRRRGTGRAVRRSFRRLNNVLDERRAIALMKAEYAAGHQAVAKGAWAHEYVKRIESSGASDVPEAGSIRVVAVVEHNGAVVARVANYFTPRRYRMQGPLNDSPEAADFAAMLASYRITERPCGAP